MKLLNILFAIALTAAVISCFISLSFGATAVVVVIVSDLFCYALMKQYSNHDRIFLGVFAAIAWLLLIFA